MADLDKKQNGASAVDQNEDIDDMIDDPIDDIDETKKIPINDLKEKDLDRGQEIYTGFGFGGVDGGGVSVADISQNMDGENASLDDKNMPSPRLDKNKAPGKAIYKEGLRDINANNRTADGQKTFDGGNQSKIRRELPEDTKLVIKADDGDVVYKESNIDRAEASPRSTGSREQISPASYGLEKPINTGYTVDVPADYQLAGVYYGNDFRDNNKIYLAKSYQTDTYSIKRHYKNQADCNCQGGWPVKKIGLGAAVVAGLLCLKKNNDKGFWE